MSHKTTKCQNTRLIALRGQMRKGQSNMFTRYELYKIKDVLDNIVHCGDYGRFYINKLDRSVFLELGDCDKIEVDELAQKLPTDVAISISSEYGPDDEENWVLVSRGIESYESYKFELDETTKTIVLHPNVLSIDEYVDYYRFFKSLKDE